MNIKTQRGSILLYAMLMMSVMLAIGLTLNALFISKLRSAAAVRDSTAALYAADSAAEKCLYEVRHGANQPPMTFSNGAQYSIVSIAPGNPDITDNCVSLGSSSFGFRATGTYRGTRRTLEISQ
jgi:Tfp pilus assembly protein PilX